MRKSKKEQSINPRIKRKLSYWYGFLVIFYQKKYYFEKPMRTLSQAAKMVAEGDFAVCIAPYQKPEKYEYIATIVEASKKLDSLITNVLKYYRTETI